MVSLAPHKFHLCFLANSFLFRRWLPATPGADHSQCRPNPSSYDWFEYTTSADCTTASCRFHAFNYMTANVSTPYFEEIYLHSALDLGNGRLGQLGLGYFDKPGGAYAVGTIRTLDDDSGGLQMANDCHDAFHTLETIREKYDLTLSFELKNNCPPKGGERNQLGASSYWQKVLGSFQRSNGDLK